jgi:hypothetical protein
MHLPGGLHRDTLHPAGQASDTGPLTSCTSAPGERPCGHGIAHLAGGTIAEKTGRIIGSLVGPAVIRTFHPGDPASIPPAEKSQTVPIRAGARPSSLQAINPFGAIT